MAKTVSITITVSDVPNAVDAMGSPIVDLIVDKVRDFGKPFAVTVEETPAPRRRRFAADGTEEPVTP